MPAERNLLMAVVRNFIKSLTPSRQRGQLIGGDYFGNRYYEQAANPSRGKRHPRRWIVPVGGNFDQEMPAEWEAWLRRRRLLPPADDEVARNKAVMDMKKVNAAKLAVDRGEQIEAKPHLSAPEFPVWDEYEVEPGHKNKKKKL